MKYKPIDLMFFLILGIALFVALWLLKGSPTLTSALISITLFVAASELLLWRKVFDVDKNTAVSFARLKSDLTSLTYGQQEMNSKLNTLINQRD